LNGTSFLTELIESSVIPAHLVPVVVVS